MSRLSPNNLKWLLLFDQTDEARAAAEAICLRLAGAGVPVTHASAMLASEAERVAAHAVALQVPWEIGGFDQEIADAVKLAFAYRIHQLTSAMTQWGTA